MRLPGSKILDSNSLEFLTAPTNSPALGARLGQPRVILWIGPTFENDASLMQDLGRLPLTAIYLKKQDDCFERALRGGGEIGGHAIGLATADEVHSRNTQYIPIFYLEGRPGTKQPSSRRQDANRRVMLEELDKLVEDHPIIVGLGLDKDQGALQELLENVGTYAPDMPILLLGSNERYQQLGRDIRLDEEPAAGAVPIDGGWAELTTYLRRIGVELGGQAAAPSILVRQQTVRLSDVFRDPNARIDGAFRIITKQAFNKPKGGPSLNVLFHQFMSFDERVLAAQAESDHIEWWAIAERVPFQRTGRIKSIRQTVLNQLKSIEGRDYSRPQICWLPAEPGSGTTTLLHMIALDVARQGYPVLLLKQLVTDVHANQVLNFLTEVNQLTNQASKQASLRGHPERPVLLVLDTTHAGISTIERLPDQLVRIGGHSVLTLWAVRVQHGAELPKRTQKRRHRSNAEHHGDLFIDLREISPAENHVFLPIQRADIDSTELEALKRHVEALRNRGVLIPPRDERSWQKFQENNRFHSIAGLHVSEHNDASQDSFSSAEEIFWILLYHFLATPDEDPLTSVFEKRVSSFLKDGKETAGEKRALALLIEIAKASAAGIIVPQSVLLDWQEQREWGTSQAAPDLAPTEHSVIEITSDILAAIRQSLARNRMRSSLRSPIYEVRREIEALSEAGLVRSLLVDGMVQVRFAHRALAHRFLIYLARQGNKLDARLPGTLEEISQILGERPYAGVRSLLRTLRRTELSLTFSEYISENLLRGDDTWAGWQLGWGEHRWEVYQEIPQELREQSRILLHHAAIILRRTTFADEKMISRQEKVRRLRKATELLERALSLPWRSGRRDEHPGHIQTTLGYVYKNLSQYDPVQAHVYKRLAEEKLQQALLEIPDSKHTRWLLAELLLERALAVWTEPDGRMEAVKLATDCLRLLSVEPNERTKHMWYKTKREARALFDQDDGHKYLRELQEAGVEDGFLLAAEIELSKGNVKAALDLLQPLVAKEQWVLRHLRSARRVAEIMAHDSDLAKRHAERYRLLKAVEEGGVRLTPEEEYQLAYLEYQLGHYVSANSRFAGLRATLRHQSLGGAERPLLVDDKGDSKILTGVVDTIDEDDQWGWMQVREVGSGIPLFRVRFRVMHFFPTRPPRHAQAQTLIRFYPSGPRAVSQRFRQD